MSSSSVYFHFLKLCLQRPIFVRSLFRHLHSVHVPGAPLARHSLAGAETTAPICEWMGSGSVRLLQDLRRFLGRLWPFRGCLLSFTCFSRSRWAVTLLLTAGGAMPARRYKFSTLVGCRHSVMAWQASFSTGSTLCDLSHTGHAYSAVE